MTVQSNGSAIVPSIDVDRLDALLGSAGVDAFVATSRHNVGYVAGLYSSHFHHNQALAEDQYLMAVGCVRERLDQAFLVASPQDAHEFAVTPPWLPTVDLVGYSTVDTARGVARLLAERGLEKATIGIEEPFVPLRFHRELVRLLPDATFVDITRLLSDLRVVKSPEELRLLRIASEKVVDAMHATMAGAAAGSTTRELYDQLAAEQTARGLTFEFCAITTGTSPARFPSSERRWEPGTVLSFDSGGSLNGYYADLTRMAVLGEPTPRMRDLLDQATVVTDAARAALRPGVTGREVLEATFAVAAQLPDMKGLSSNESDPGSVSFNIHGVGVTRHESPRIEIGGPVADDPPRLDEPIAAGTVLSVDTILPTPDVGLVKLEDMVAVTADGIEGYGDAHRGWTIVPC